MSTQEINDGGFLAREGHKIQFSDLSEAFMGGIILTKLTDFTSITPTAVNFSLLDIFKSYKTIDELENILSGASSNVRNKNSEYISDLVRLLTSVTIEPKENTVDLISFYNQSLSNSLHFLATGDTAGLKACILSYDINKTNALETYTINLIPKIFVELCSQNILSHLSLNDELYQKFSTIVDDTLPSVNWRKQVEFVQKHLDERQSLTGEIDFDFNLKESIFRHILVTTGDENNFTLPTPFSLDGSQRTILPLFLETNGIIDINLIKLTNSPVEINDIEIVYSISKPAILNKYSHTAYNLSPQQRSVLSQTELHVFESVYKQLNNNYCFGGRPDIAKSFADLFHWTIRKLTFCLEEPSFLKEKSESWLKDHASDNYQQMEDNFFLPFIYEKLKDSFGNRVSKKPEKFGGEIDILFEDIPLELKVRKKEGPEIIDLIVESKYRPASQAATYAATTRLGFVFTLDLPHRGALTNIDNCVKVVAKVFENTVLNTCIVVCIFYCDLPKPSSAK